MVKYASLSTKKQKLQLLFFDGKVCTGTERLIPEHQINWSETSGTHDNRNKASAGAATRFNITDKKQLTNGFSYSLA